MVGGNNPDTGPGQAEQRGPHGQESGQSRTGPASGNTRGNDLLSSGGTQRDGRRIEGASGTPNVREAPGRNAPDAGTRGHDEPRAAADPRDLKERKDEALASDDASSSAPEDDPGNHSGGESGHDPRAASRGTPHERGPERSSGAAPGGGESL